MIYALPGTGTSWLSMMIAYTAAAGSTFPAGRWEASRQHRVLYISSDVRKSVDRLLLLWDSVGPMKNANNIVLYPKPRIGNLSPENLGEIMDYTSQVDISSEDFWDELDNAILEADVIVIDRIRDLIPKVYEKDAWEKIINKIDYYKSAGGKKRAFLIVNHSLIKTGKPVGSIRFSAYINTIIRIKKPQKLRKTYSFAVEKSTDWKIGRELRNLRINWKKRPENGKLVWTLVDTDKGEISE